MWHILENEYGTKEYEAGYGSNMKNIKTPEDLLWLMNTRSND
jgi:hypothetical protein